MIPKNITKSNVLQAISKIDREGVPDRRQSTKYLLYYRGCDYPPKYVVALANEYANGELLDSELFGGGIETNGFLEGMGFEIILKSNREKISAHYSSKKSSR